MKDIYILGVGHNTVVYIDLIEKCGYHVAGLYHYEKGRTGELYFGYKIVGTHDELFTSDLSGKQFAISVGDNEIRSRLYNKLRDNAGIIPTLVHPSAIVSRYAQLGQGVIIHANSVISPDVIIGDDSVVSSNDLITHGSRMGAHCFIASNVVLGAYVTMQDYAFIGSGATIISGKVSYIGKGALIGAGAVVTKNVEPNKRVAGNPAREI
ncbi:MULTISPECIES: NeuD/PglB/VioB family sugar acetyltransferase [Bacteroides]|jgi:sugar O-acyltransferase (sialic acid O-acetyltransferase NeuD family)|uniref:NeuD/PglB/VioB family sugar acetyltransferase n=1 Tax=Bacteroides TaxID=816 RepID=UPI000E4E5E77|nr:MULTISPECIES: NeuD/PglB/VioB family sugar acetyltransferase [Bacteroides]RHL07438.1 transferase [Bacteroides sp. AF39-11AC]